MGLRGLNTGFRKLATGLGGSGGAAPTPWSPGDLPGLQPSLQVALSLSQGGLWQDAGKTVPATEDGDPVRVATCPWTGEDYVAPSDSARPLLWDDGGGKWSLALDGADDQMVCASAWPAAAMSCVLRVLTDAGTAPWPVLIGGAVSGTLGLAVAAGTLYVFNQGVAGAVLSPAVDFSSDAYHTASWWSAVGGSAGDITARVDGGATGTATPPAAPATGAAVRFGRDGDSGAFVSGRYAGFALYAADHSSDLALLEPYFTALA